MARLDEGPLRLGRVARIHQPMQPESDWIVTELVPGRRFSWESRRRGLHLTGSHEIVLAGAGTGNALAVEARGPVAALLWPLLRAAIGHALRQENRGLKAAAEKG